VRVALCQTDIAWNDVAANHERAADALSRASAQGARLALLPEMFSTGFCLDASRVAQPRNGPSEVFLLEQAAARDLWVLASVPTRSAGDALARNEALLVSPRGEVTRYAKIHPFSFAGEDRSYAGGDRVVTADVEGVRVTPFVCYDLRFPEPFRLAAADTDLFALVASWPERRRAHWRTLLAARAIENLCYVAGVNRVGEGDSLHYSGDSMLVSPWGETLLSAAEGVSVLVGEVNPAAVAEARLKFPALRDVRPAAYRR
jgi:predicted amidohydrolase